MESGGRQGPPQRPYRMRARAQAAEATAAAIIAAARALFAEGAYDEVSLPAIAVRAAVTVQTVLRRFGSKEELFAAAARERSDEIRADREAAPAGDIMHLVAHYERWGDEQAHLLAQEARVPAIRAITDACRRYHRDWITRAYAPALTELPPPPAAGSSPSSPPSPTSPPGGSSATSSALAKTRPRPRSASWSTPACQRGAARWPDCRASP